MNDIYKPGDTVYSYFAHQGPGGQGTPATSITGIVYRNQNIDVTASPTFAHLGTGLYRNTYPIPAGFSHGDQITVLAQATLTGTPGPPTPIWEGRLVNWPTDALPPGGYGTGQGLANARQVREEMDANSTHLSSMDSRIPGTPAQYGQIGTPGRGSVAAELSHIDAVAESIYNRAPTLAQMVAALQNERVTGTVTGSPTTTSVPLSGSDLSQTDDAYNGGFLLLTSGAMKGVARKITDYAGSSTTPTTQAFPVAPAVGASVAIIGNVPS